MAVVPAYLFVIILTCGFSCPDPKPAITWDPEQSIPLFDGKTLDGWNYDSTYWRVENGNLVGEVTPSTILTRNSFIVKRGFVVNDFELTVDYRISAEGNSGINYRSKVIRSVPHAMQGYQADIDGKNNYTGQNYEERGRTTLAYQGQQVVINESVPLANNIRNNAWTRTKVTASLGNLDSLKRTIIGGDWNRIHLVVKGNRMLHYVNGVLMSDVTDNDTLNRSTSGLLGVQVHVGPPMKIEYRNFQFTRLRSQ